jgi:hypothetical protein
MRLNTRVLQLGLAGSEGAPVFDYSIRERYDRKYGPAARRDHPQLRGKIAHHGERIE